MAGGLPCRSAKPKCAPGVHGGSEPLPGHRVVEPFAVERRKALDLFRKIGVLLDFRMASRAKSRFVVDRTAHLRETVGDVLEKLVDDLRHAKEVFDFDGPRAA